MLTFQEFCDAYCLDTWVQVVYDAEELRKNGQIGDCAMRNLATFWQKNLDFPLEYTNCMQSIISEAYRRVALEMLDMEP